MILIIAPEDDVHVSYVTKKLEGRGVAYLHFDPQHFPSQAGLSVQHGRDGSRSLFLDYRDVAHDLQNVRSVWNRARVRPIADAKVRRDQTWWVGECCARFLSEAYECLDCLWLPERPSSNREAFRIYNPPDKTSGANPTRSAPASPYNKLHQLELAGRLGFAVPRTLVTNNPDRFLDFFESANGEIITKRAANLVTYLHGEKTVPFTHSVRRRDAGNFRSVRYAPVIVQEKVAKKFELRVTVVGDAVFAAEIHSQELLRLQTDWRHSRDYGGGSYHARHALPALVAQRCVDLVSALGLCFGAIDLILTPDDEYVFLEINPNGQWAWIEDFTGLPISDAIADLLIAG